jgi:hypothetical protein
MSKTGLNIAKAGITIVWLGLLSGAGLADDSSAAAAPKQAVGAPAQVHRMSPGKPRPPVEARLVQAQGLEPGVPANLLLQLQGRPGIEILDVQVEGGDGLSVVNVVPMHLVGTAAEKSQAAGARSQWQVSATPTEGGTGQLSGLVTFRVNGVLQAAQFNLPVQVGGFKPPPRKPSQKPMGSLVTAPGGELIDSMPAETTVR